MKEAKRVLKQSGELVIAEIHWPFVLRFIGNIFLPLLKSGDVKIYSPKELERLLCKNSFTEVSVTKCDNIQIVKGVNKCSQNNG